MELPLVSIVTPVYNQSEYLAEAIESVLAQDYPHLEYVVIDDGSTDGTVDVLTRYTGRLRWERQQNLGQAATLNRGWGTSQGSILGYLSADDVLLPKVVSSAVRSLLENTDTVMVYPDCDIIDPYGRIIRRSVFRAFDYASLVVDQECYVGPGAFFRRSAFEVVGGWDPTLKLAPDREFWMRLGLLGRFLMIPEVLALYRMHPGTVSYSQTDAFVASEYVRVLERYFSRRDIPLEIQARRKEAFARAYVVEARIHLRGGRLIAAVQSLGRAKKTNPGLKMAPFIVMLGRAVISRQVHRFFWSLRQLRQATRSRIDALCAGWKQAFADSRRQSQNSRRKHRCRS